MDYRKHTYSDGSKYEGEWKDGKRHGHGTWIRPDGLKYEGEWKDDKPNGPGTLTNPDGRKRIGEWKDGKFVKEKPPSESPEKTIEQLEKENADLKKEVSALKQQLLQSNQLNKQDVQMSNQAEQQKPKRSNTTRNILIGIGVIIILFFVFALINQGDDDTPSADRSAEGVPEDQETMDQPSEDTEAADDEDTPTMQFISMGETTSFAEWEYSVIDVEYHTLIEDNRPRGIYVVFMLEATNNSNVPREIGYMFQVEDDQGRVFAFDSSASLDHYQAYKTDTWHHEEIGPSFSGIMPLAFDVAEDAETLYLYPIDIRDEEFEETAVIEIEVQN